MTKQDPIRELLNDDSLRQFIARFRCAPGLDNVTVVILRNVGAESRDDSDDRTSEMLLH